jgi:hypothetical protein
MKDPVNSAAKILAQMAQVDVMEVGTLSEYRPPGRSKDSPTYFKLQVWKDGKNRTCHIPADEVAEVRAALDGYARFQALSEQYVEEVVAQTRARREEGLKKKTPPSPRLSRKKSTDSSSPS